jgi:hypothetical protein
MLVVERLKGPLAPTVNPLLSRPFGRVLRHLPSVALAFVMVDNFGSSSNQYSKLLLNFLLKID